MLWFNITLGTLSLAFSLFHKHNMLPAHVYTEKNTRDPWGIPWYTIQKHCIFILYHARKYWQWPTQSMQHTVCAAHEGKVGCNIVKYLTAFLYSGWLYFLWHGITSPYSRTKEKDKLFQLQHNPTFHIHAISSITQLTRHSGLASQACKLTLCQAQPELNQGM